MLAPLPGARWLALKALPLALLVPGSRAAQRRPRQWLALLLPLYFAEALVRALTEAGRHGVVAAMAAALVARARSSRVRRLAAPSRASVARGPSLRRLRVAVAGKPLRHREHDALDDAVELGHARSAPSSAAARSPAAPAPPAPTRRP